MFAYLINQTNPGIKRTYILKRNFTAKKHSERSAPSPWKNLLLVWVNPTEKHLCNNYHLYQIRKWVMDSEHYFSENHNRITVNTVLVNILKRTRLQPKMTNANYHVICKQESFKWPEYFPLCEDTPISFIIIHDRIKHVCLNRKSELYGLRIKRFFSAHDTKRPQILKLCNIYHIRLTLPNVEDLYCRNEFSD